jgi:phage shock protein A
MSLPLKKTVYWLFGPSAGRVLVSTVNWLFTGRYIAEGGQIATNVAKTAVEDITEQVRLQAQSVAQAKSALAEIQRLYSGMVKQHDDYGSQAKLAVSQGKDAQAAVVLNAQIQLEDAMEQARQDVDGAEEAVSQAESAYRQAQEDLESYKLQQQSIEIQNQINEARKQIAEVAAGSNKTLESAKEQFKQAKDAVRRRGDTQKAYLGLQESETGKAFKDLGKASADAAVQERIAKLKGGQTPFQLPVSLPDKQKQDNS